MIKRCLLPVMASALLALGAGALAAAEPGRFEVTAPVPDQSVEARQKALGEGLRSMVVRVTGRPGVVNEPAVRELIDEPGRFVQRFRYLVDEQGSLMLNARFDDAALREALGERGVAVWQTDRPPLLAWVVVDSPSARRFLDGDNDDGLSGALKAAAGGYGLSLLFPDLDAARRDGVSLSDISGGFSGPVLEASRPYETPLVLMATVRRSGADWQARWMLDTAGEQYSDRVSGSSPEVVFDAMALALANRLRESFAAVPDPSSLGEVALWVIDIDTLADFERARRVLKDLPGVSGVAPAVIRGDAVRFRLATQMARSRILTYVDGVGVLSPATPGDVPAPRGRDGERGEDADAGVRAPVPSVGTGGVVTSGVVDPALDDDGAEGSLIGRRRAGGGANEDAPVYRLGS